MSTPTTVAAKLVALGAAINKLGTSKWKSLSAFLTQYGEKVTKITVDTAAKAAIDLTLNNVYELTLKQANSAITLVNPPTQSGTNLAFSITLYLIQGQAGALVTWPSSINWQDDIVPTLSTALNKVDVITLSTRDGGVHWTGFVSATGRSA